MKKLGTLVLALALTVMFAVPAMSAHRTLKKSLVKTEISTKVVKADIVTINQVLPVNVSYLTPATHFELLEANRPPGFILAYANCAPFTRYIESDALKHETLNKNYNMQSTVVELNVVSKKSGHQWGQKSNPVEHEIELAVGYDQNSVFFKQSGGTNMVLKTINQDAADLFKIGEVVVMTITPKEEIPDLAV